MVRHIVTTVLLLTACLSLAAGKTAVDVAIVTAVSEEFGAVVRALDVVGENMTFYGRFFQLGEMANKSVVVTICGVGMTNAAMTTQLTVDQFDFKFMIFQGIAGGVSPNNHIGDTLIPAQWADFHHQRYIRTLYDAKSNKATNRFSYVSEFGDYPDVFYRVGDNEDPVTFLNPVNPSFPLRSPKWKQIKDIKNAPGTSFVSKFFAVPMSKEAFDDPADGLAPSGTTLPQQFWFEADEYLLNVSMMVAPTVNLTKGSIVNGNYTALKVPPEVKVGGNGGSSSTFLDNAEYRNQLYKFLKLECVEMEGASFMHVCHSTKSRCLVIRALSDLAGGNDDINEILSFLSFASDNSAKVTKAILGAIDLTM